jgi:hypothetical protein
MDLERTGVSTNALGSLRSFLVEGDPEQERRASRGKRRALVASTVVQVLVVAALVVFPLFSKGEHISFEHTPLPPYHRLGSHDPHDIHSHPNAQPPPCHFCAPTSPAHPIITQDPTRSTEPTDNEPRFNPVGDPNGVRDGDSFAAANNGPKPVVDGDRIDHRKPPRISVGYIEPALLIHRVEPVFPRLAITLHHETRVELHAIISIDGSVQSLEVLSGDPLFYNSSLEAVHQWRYRPTYLNGQPVEVDTHITVIYVLNH